LRIAGEQNNASKFGNLSTVLPLDVEMCNVIILRLVLCWCQMLVMLREGSTLHALENAVLKKALGPKCIGHLKIFIKPS
jgi:hypothetical protein